MKRIFILVAVLCVAFSLLPSAGCAQSRDEAMRLYKEADKLDENPQNKDALVKAVQKYKQAMRLFEKLGDKKRVGMCANNAGLIYENWGQYDKAVEYYEKALATKIELKDRKGEGQALKNLGDAFKSSVKYDKAKEYYEKALAIKIELKDRKGEGATLNNLGAVYSDLGRYDKAVQHYEKALAIKIELKDRKGEGQSLNDLAVDYAKWDQHQKAAEYFEKSLAIDRELKDRKGEGTSLHNLGNIYRHWGQFHKALEYYEKAVAIHRELKDHKSEGHALNMLGQVFSAWGHYDKAVEHYEKSLAIAQEFKDRQPEASALANLGNIYFYWGWDDKAVEYYEKSLAICRELKDRGDEAAIMMNVGVVRQDRGDYKKALEHFYKSLAILSEIKVPTDRPSGHIANTYMDLGDLANAEPFLKEADYYESWGRFYLLKADFAKAKEYYGKIMKSAEENRDADNLFTAYTGRGAANEGLKDDVAAADNYEKAVKQTEEIRLSLPAAEREKFFDVRIKGFYRTAPYEGLARVLMRLNKPQEAFKTTEYTRARVFAEAMTRLSRGTDIAVPAEILKQDEDINNQFAALKKSLQTGFEKNNKLVIQSLEPQVKQMEGKLQTHIRMLRETYPLFAATKYPQPMDLSQTALKDNEWVLSYDLGDPGLLIYLTKGKNLIKSLFKPVPRKELDDLVRKFRQPLEIKEGTPIRDQLKEFDFPSGKKLGDILLSDVLPLLPKDAPVIIIPSGSLGIVPFEMLILNDSGKITADKGKPSVIGAEFFGDRNPISYYQSVTALTLARTLGKRKGTGEKVLVMDDPVFGPDDPRVKQAAQSKKQTTLAALPDKLMSIKKEIGLTFPRLPLTGELGQSLKKLEPSKTDEFTGIQAAKAVLFDKPLNQYNSMIFATHGYFGKDLPGIMEPVLVLTLPGQPEGKDGFLRLSEVMGLNLNADTVALTACQTGLGRHISGEGTMGMGRAFQYAGARSVLMSLWSVSEAGSVKLVESFFRNLKDGKNKLEALRLARQEIRQSGYDHPFYWAPFILVGEVK